MNLTRSGPSISEETLILFGLFLLLGWVAWLIFRYRQRSQERRLDFQARLLARFDSTQELRQFLQSESGRALIGTGQPKLSWNRIMTAFQVSLLLSALGFMFLLLAMFLGEPQIVIPGVLLLSVGVAFLGSAGFSYWLSRKHGLLEDPAESNKPEIEP